MKRSWGVWVPAVLALLPLLRSLDVGFFLDDWIGLALLERHGAAEILRDSLLQPGSFLRPVGWVLFAGEWRLFGLTGVAWHATHIVLFGVACLLTGLLAGRLAPADRRGPVTAVTTALALAYPGRVEAYAWIAAVFDLLALLAVVAALILAVDASRRDGRGRLLALGLLAFLGPLAKETAFCLPVLVAVVTGITARPRRWSPVTAATLGAAAALGLRLLWQGTVLPEVARPTPPPEVAWLPLRAVFFPFRPDLPVALVAAGLAAFVMAGAVALLVRPGASGAARRLGLLGAAVFSAGLLPALPFLTPNTLEAHSRYLTLPGAGVALLGGTLLLHRGRLATFGAVAAVALCLAWTSVTWVRLDAWVDAAERRDGILGAVETATRLPGPHAVWIEGPINRHRDVPLLGGALEAAVEVSLPERDVRVDSAFSRRYRRLPDTPPAPSSGRRLHRIRSISEPPWVVLLE